MFINEYKVTVYRYQDDTECYWVAKTAEFPAVSGVGDTRQEALDDLDDALEATIAFSLELGMDIPAPTVHASAIQPRRTQPYRFAIKPLAARSLRHRV